MTNSPPTRDGPSMSSRVGKDRAEWCGGGNSLPLPLIQIFVPLLHIQSSFMTLLLHKLLYVDRNSSTGEVASQSL